MSDRYVMEHARFEQYVLGLQVSVHNIVLVKIVDAFEDRADNGDGILLGEFPLL